MPTEVEVGKDGVPVKVVSHFGPNGTMDSIAHVTRGNRRTGWPPKAGTTWVPTMPRGGTVRLLVRLYLYGDEATPLAAREEPRWQAWMTERFPSAGECKCVAQEA